MGVALFQKVDCSWSSSLNVLFLVLGLVIFRIDRTNPAPGGTLCSEWFCLEFNDSGTSALILFFDEPLELPSVPLSLIGDCANWLIGSFSGENSFLPEFECCSLVDLPSEYWGCRCFGNLPVLPVKCAFLLCDINWYGVVLLVLPVDTHSFESVPTTRVAIKNPDCVNVWW